ncbi:rhomboid family intramembrane serine protease [Nocardioides sp.]|uniref:rhomboid family intramembrane serine protease n=1 Tax=Nocardioides sp. TaxID=35761 RepID=UPI00271B7E4E|nr:rhomboid family intramembrane serine protease [Nocardioides sp.]MDO9458234.1 rhomboid family intramembrane serine protease [Nocardioides sp.]
MSDPAPGVTVCYRHAGREANIRCQRCERPICTECMRDAAVGFQCPSCIKEGARTTRQAVAPYGGARSTNPALTSYVLIGINVALWIAVVATGWQSSRLIYRLSLLPVGLCESVGDPDSYYRADSAAQCALVGADGRWVAGVADGAYWQLVTSAFMHVELWHIAGNMLALFFLGPQVESVLGRARFLAVYLVAGLAGSAAAYWLSSSDSYSLGASGAIYGLFGALGVLIQKVGGDLRQIGGLLVVNVVITFAVPNISWQAHLGGLVGGALVTAIIVYAPRGVRRATVQWSALFGVVALLPLADVLRSAVLV